MFAAAFRYKVAAPAAERLKVCCLRKELLESCYSFFLQQAL